MLGAWTVVETAQQILDVGTGTGVIALMLAQRSKVQITAIEPAFEAFSLAHDNFQSSPFAARIQIHHTSFENFQIVTRYDVIVCNPPFFENSLKPQTPLRQQQRHSDSLSPSHLLEHADRLLTPTGKLSVVLPTEEGNRFMEQASIRGFYLLKSTAVFSKIGKPQERWLLAFGKQKTQRIETNSLTLLDSTGQWTEEYKLLTADFYLRS